jgi:T-complex protein 1 subunit eta
MNEDIGDNMEACVWEPALVKKNALTAACEAACLILSVDETVKNPKAQGGGQADQPMPMPMGRGGPRRPR